MTTAASPVSSLDPQPAASLPRQVGPYTLFEPIGKGGMAELFLARAETELGATRLAVVKLILPAFANDPKFADMLVHEAKLAASLSHRHIVNVFDLGRDAGGRPYIAMEYVEGFDLNALLRLCTQRGEGLPAGHALGIIVDVLEGLDYAHRKRNESGAPLGIVHRDVSPSNVLISYEGEVKLCDFGIAHANDLVRDAGEALKGKAGYMSPEHAHGEPIDARSDVFATGIILWELLVGRRLYRPKIDMSLIEQARRAEVPAIEERGLPNHAALARIVQRALARDRDERFPSADAFARALEEYLAGAGLLSNRLKLGEWIAKTFGTGIIEQRRASERRLPKSNPPPRSSGAMHVRPAVDVVVPRAPRVPSELAAEVTPTDSLLEGFAASSTLPVSSLPPPGPAPSAAPSLEGATMDIEPSSSELAAPAESSRESDEEVLAWARRRGYVSFLFFFLIAAAVAVVWVLTR